jgi:Ca-activated chloride channel homolog
MARSPNESIVTFRRDGQVVGVGFLVGRQHILTCAHVINVLLDRDPYSQDRPADDVEITAEFALVDHHPTRRATVVWWVPPTAKGEPMSRACDIAGLRLLSTETPPPGSKGLKFVKPKARAEVEAFGYPADPPRNNGGWVTGQLLREVDNGLVQIDSDLRAALRAQPGYSGSPVVDIWSGRAAGIITSASTRAGQRDSYAVASTRLHKLWPDTVTLTRAVRPPPMPPRTKRRIGVGALLLVVLVLVAWGVREFSGGSTPAAVCVPLEISVSTEKDELLAELASEYNAREHDGPCARVSTSGFTSGKAMNALAAEDWSEEADDPRPQVWLPTSSMWTDLLREAGRGDLVAEELPPVTTSVLAVAMPQRMADAVREEHGDVTWRQIRDLAGPDGGWDSIDHPDLGPFVLGRDNPNFSTSGLAASVATYFAATDKRSGLTENELHSGDVTRFVRDIETSAIRYGEEATEFMATLYEEDQAKDEPSVSAVFVQEQLVHLYNRGAPTGDVKELDQGKPPSEPLVAVQPAEGTVVLDHPFVLLSPADAEQRAAAADFHEFLVEDAQQQRFVELGFRELDRPDQPTDVLVESSGVPAESRQTFFELPEPSLIKAMQDAWDGVRNKARVLLVLDVSWSMDQQADKTDASRDTKLDLLREAAKNGLKLLGDNDEVGIWTFADTVSKPLEMSPVGKVRDQLNGIIDGLTTANNTALYRAVGEAHDAMLDLDNDKINAVVVLTDGEQIPRIPAGPESLLSQIDAENVETSVRVFTVPYGAGADRNLLQQIATRSKAVSYDATNPDDIEEVMVSVFSNFGG